MLFKKPGGGSFDTAATGNAFLIQSLAIYPLSGAGHRGHRSNGNPGGTADRTPPPPRPASHLPAPGHRTYASDRAPVCSWGGLFLEPECRVQARLWGSCGESPHRCGAGSTGGGVRTAGRRHGEALGHSAWRCHCLARLPFLFPFRAVSESPPRLFPRTPESSVYPPHQGARFTPRSSSAPGPRRSCSEARRKQGRASTPPPVLGARTT